jgi:hypothetical protein
MLRKALAAFSIVLGLSITPMLIIASVLVKAYWMTPFLIVFWAAEVYTVLYRRSHAKKKEKLQMKSQIPTRRYYYDRWYLPADSTRLNYMAGKIREVKKKIRRE